jgi:hypothetical protein
MIGAARPMPISESPPRSRAARFFFMHLGTLVAIFVYFYVYASSGGSLEGLRSALVTALVVKTGYMAVAYWQGEHKQFDVGIWVLFAVGTVAVFAGIEPVVGLYRLYSGALVFATFGLTAIVPLLAGREPFTLYYARRQLPRWQLRTKEFRALSRVVAVYWAILFFAAAGLCVYRPLDPTFTFLLPNALVLGAGLSAQRWLPPLYFRIFPPELPTVAEPLIMAMPMVFRPDAAGDARARIQFHVRGAEPGSYWLRIGGGKCESFDGVADAADVTIDTPDDVWVGIAHGKIDGAKALAEKLYRVEGDLLVLARMKDWFASR